MLLIAELIKNVVWVFLSVIQFAMLLRAILSWFIMENGFVNFLHAITEPFVFPVRWLFQKLNWFQNIPIDISFLVSYLLLSVIGMLLA